MKSKNTSLQPKTLVNANTLINDRKQLDRDIALGWRLIRVENLMPKGVDRSTDIKELYYKLVTLSETRLRTKLDIQCINMGLKSRSELSDSAVYPLIYLLSELREREVALGKIPTLLKTSVNGKRYAKHTNVLSQTFIKEELRKIHAEVTRILKTLSTFNATTMFNTDGDYDLFATTALAS